MQKVTAELPESPVKFVSHPTDQILERWMQIKRFPYQELQRLHECEKKWETQNRSHPKEIRNLPENNWVSRGISLLMQINQALGMFWPSRTPDDLKKLECDRFKSHIYTIWRPIFDEHDQEKISFIDCLHYCDTKIHNDPYQFPPDVIGASGPTGGEMGRLKTARDQAYEPGADN